MHNIKQIAIILNDTLQCIGVQSLLDEYFSPVSIYTYQMFAELEVEENISFDYFFTDTDTFVLNSEFFLPRRNKTIVFTHAGYIREGQNIPFADLHINIRQSKDFIINRLSKFFNSESQNDINKNTKDLSFREVDVLQLIVKGITNKEIADKLNISLNTVLSHRKNIISKLGIKTVSGLTYYAIMNGFASSEDIGL